MFVVVGWWKNWEKKGMKNPTFCLITVLSVLLFTSGREKVCQVKLLVYGNNTYAIVK